MAGLDDDDAEGSLASLAHSGLIRTTLAGEVEFAHPLFGQALYDDIPTPLRTRLHARAFALFAERGRETEAASHAVRARMVGDPTAVVVLGRVGRGALRKGAFETATAVLQAAVEFAAASPSAELLLDYAQALTSGGRAADSVPVCERVLGDPGLAPITRARTLRLLARTFVYMGAYEAAAARYEAAADVATDPSP